MSNQNKINEARAQLAGKLRDVGYFRKFRSSKPEHLDYFNGWYAHVANCVAGNLAVAITFDRVAGFEEPKFWTGFSGSRKEIERLVRQAPIGLQPKLVLEEDEAYDLEAGNYRLKKRPTREELKLPVVEHYQRFGSYFGIYRLGLKYESEPALQFLTAVISDDYQLAANKIAADESEPPSSGPQPAPANVRGSNATKYRRNPRQAAWAIHQAKYKCEIDPEHKTFISRTTRKPFVEAHHLIPMQQQLQFEVSLDVWQNIIALCPGCHRKIHHGEFSELQTEIEQLLFARTVGLRSRGILIKRDKLHSIYKQDVAEN